jgi:hypothetical protein
MLWRMPPARLPELIKNPKTFEAMLKMKKMDTAELERAARGRLPREAPQSDDFGDRDVQVY